MSRARLAYWALFSITLAVYVAMLFWSLPAISDAAGGLVPFDLRPGGYDDAQAQAFLNALSADGRSFYLTVQHRLDTAFPALMGATLCFATLWLYGAARRLIRICLAVIPIIGGAFDWLENSYVAAMLSSPVDLISHDLIAAASQATVLKSAFNTAAMLVVLVGLARLWLTRRDRL
ncbi:MAG: hypothetical protein V3U96_02280 [Paracoccaceae bacterium]